MLRDDARVEAETARVRFIEFGSSSMNLEIYAYIKETDFAAFLKIQEELMLSIMDIIAESGARLALPSQIACLDRDGPNGAGKKLPITSTSGPDETRPGEQGGKGRSRQMGG